MVAACMERTLYYRVHFDVLLVYQNKNEMQGMSIVCRFLIRKKSALDVIMQQFSKDTFEYSANEIEKIVIIKVQIESMTGKRSGGRRCENNIS